MPLEYRASRRRFLRKLDKFEIRFTLFTLYVFVVHTRGIWQVLSTVFYISNRFTNPIMFGIILKSYFSSMLWHKFNEDIIMQTRKILF